MPKSNGDSPETPPVSSNVEIDHRINPIVDRNAHPPVGPLEGVGMESLIVSDAFLALPTIEFCHNRAHGTEIERRADIIHTLPPVFDAIPPGLHDLAMDKAISTSGWEEG